MAYCAYIQLFSPLYMSKEMWMDKHTFPCFVLTNYIIRNISNLQMKNFKHYQKFLIGVGAVTSAAVYYLTGTDKRLVYTSWTTNYTLSSPFAKWDENWDQ